MGITMSTIGINNDKLFRACGLDIESKSFDTEITSKIMPGNAAKISNDREIIVAITYVKSK